MTSFDIAAIVDELSSKLVGARIIKVYHLVDSQTVILRLRLADRSELLSIQASRKVCLTKYDVKMPKEPSQFAMQLRKEIKGGVIEGVSQQGFDRIVSVKIRAGGRSVELLAELLPRGNVVLLENGLIKAAMFRKVMKDRKVERGEKYVPPPSNTLHPNELKKEDLASFLGSGGSVGRILAGRLGYGPPYADEICIRAGVKPEENASAIDNKIVQKIIDSARKVYMMSKEHRSPRLYRDSNDALVGFSPFELQVYSQYSSRGYETVNQLVDDYFTELEAIEKWAMSEKARAEKEERRIESERRIKETAEDMLRRAKKLREAGNIVFSNMEAFQEMIDAARARREVFQLGPIERVEAAGLKLKICVSGSTLEFPVHIGVPKIASSLFEEAKRLEKDYEMIMKRIEKQEGLAEGEKAERAKIPEKRKRRAWFESFRWFISSDGILVVCARDSTSNESLIKKHSMPNNPVFHSEVAGAPFVLVQADSEKVPQSTLEEAAQMAASFTTRAWQAGYSSLDVFWVRAEQLTKTPPSGEYLKTGAFVVKGQKNYLRGSQLMLAVGAAKDGDSFRIFAAPARAVASRTATYVKIIPGKIEKRKLAEMVKARLIALAPMSEKEKIKAVPLGEILSAMPGRSGSIV
jgi:predicted ribosome quality control (RQC) complex YloA/Tae2 family protein